MVKQVVIMGAGAVARHANYIFSYDKDIQVVGFTDYNSENWGNQIDGKPILGGDEFIDDLYKKGVRHLMVGVAEPELRAKLRRQAQTVGFELVSAIHPSVIISPGARVGMGVLIAAGSVLSPNPIIHDNSFFGLSVVIAHDTVINKDCQIGGRTAVAGDVEVGQRVLLGFGSVIGRGVKVADDAIVGSGTNVVKDVPPQAVVVGNPAKLLRYRNDA